MREPLATNTTAAGPAPAPAQAVSHRADPAARAQRSPHAGLPPPRDSETEESAPTYVVYFGSKTPTEADRCALADAFKGVSGLLRRRGLRVTAYDVWRAFRWVNPRNQAAGRIGGTAAVASMTREERRARARRGGNKVFHGDPEGSDSVRASARGRLLAFRRWRKA